MKCGHNIVRLMTGGKFTCQHCGEEFVPAADMDLAVRTALRLGFAVGAVLVALLVWFIVAVVG